jgi:hypothetical protein
LYPVVGIFICRVFRPEEVSADFYELSTLEEGLSPSYVEE